MAPTLLGSGLVGAKNTTTQSPTSSFSAIGASGDICVIVAVQEQGWTSALPTAADSGGSHTVAANPTGTGYTGLLVSRRTLTGSITSATLTRNAADSGKVCTAYYFVWTGASGVANTGTPTNATATGATKTTSLTVSANSAVVMIGGDFAAAWTSCSLDDTVTPNADDQTETASASYRFALGRYTDVGSAGSKTFGVTGSGSTSILNIGWIEILASAVPRTSALGRSRSLQRGPHDRYRRAMAVPFPVFVTSSVPTSVETGVGPVGLAGSGLEVKVAVVTGTGTLGMAGTSAETKTGTEVGTGPVGLAGKGTAAKVVPQLGTQPVGMASKATAAKVDVDKGTGAVGMAGSAVDKKVAVVVGTGAIGMAGRSVDQKVATPVSRGTLGLAGRSAEVKVATPVSTGPVGLAGRSAETKVAPEVGSGWVGLAGKGTETQVGAVNERGSGTVGLAGRGLEVKVAVVTARGGLGMAGKATGAKVTAQTGRSAVGLASSGLDRKVAAAQAKGAVGMAGYHVSGTPTALWFEWTGSSELALTLQGEWTGSAVTPLTYDHVV